MGGGWMDDPWMDVRMNACLVDVYIVDGSVDNRCMYVRRMNTCTNGGCMRVRWMISGWWMYACILYEWMVGRCMGSE